MHIPLFIYRAWFFFTGTKVKILKLDFYIGEAMVVISMVVYKHPFTGLAHGLTVRNNTITFYTLPFAFLHDGIYSELWIILPTGAL